MIAVIDAEGIGTLCPGVDAEVVDENDRPLPPGQTGRIRVKTRSMVAGYVNDPEATARSFEDGWFYTTDSGMLVAPRRLKVLGRVDDVLNIGGLKFPPSEIEDAILGKTPVTEAAATAIKNSSGADELCIALVAATPANAQTATQWIRTRLWPERMGRCTSSRSTSSRARRRGRFSGTWCERCLRGRSVQADGDKMRCVIIEAPPHPASAKLALAR